MAEVKHKKGKIYYSMGEVAEMFDVNPSLIRFWEQKFDIFKPHKNKKGNRMFTPDDVDTLKLIYHLVKERGMTLAGAQKRIKQNREGESRDMEVIDRLLSIKSTLLEIRQELKVGMDEDLAEDPLEGELAESNSVIEVMADMPPAESGDPVTMHEIVEMEKQAAEQIKADGMEELAIPAAIINSDIIPDIPSDNLPREIREVVLEREQDWIEEEIERMDDVCDILENPSTAPYPQVTMQQVEQMEQAARRGIAEDVADGSGQAGKMPPFSEQPLFKIDAGGTPEGTADIQTGDLADSQSEEKPRIIEQTLF